MPAATLTNKILLLVLEDVNIKGAGISAVEAKRVCFPMMRDTCPPSWTSWSGRSSLRMRIPTIWTQSIPLRGRVVEETLAITTYCAIKNSDDFEAALVASVTHNGDSDSTGAAAGNIMGAHRVFPGY